MKISRLSNSDSSTRKLNDSTIQVATDDFRSTGNEIAGSSSLRVYLSARITGLILFSDTERRKSRLSVPQHTKRVAQSHTRRWKRGGYFRNRRRGLMRLQMDAIFEKISSHRDTGPYSLVTMTISLVKLKQTYPKTTFNFANLELEAATQKLLPHARDEHGFGLSFVTIPIWTRNL